MTTYFLIVNHDLPLSSLRAGPDRCSASNKHRWRRNSCKFSPDVTMLAIVTHQEPIILFAKFEKAERARSLQTCRVIAWIQQGGRHDDRDLTSDASFHRYRCPTPSWHPSTSSHELLIHIYNMGCYPSLIKKAEKRTELLHIHASKVRTRHVTKSRLYLENRRWRCGGCR